MEKFNYDLMLQDAITICNDTLGLELGNNIQKHVERKNVTSYLGRCIKKRNNQGIIRIQINTNMTEYEEVMNTLVHEVLHAFTTDNKHHGGQWKRYAYIMSSKTQYHIERTSNKALDVEYKYTVTCEGCGQQVGYTRKTNLVKQILENDTITYRCGKCKSSKFTVKVNR